MNCNIKSLYLCVTDMERAILFYESFFEQKVTVKDNIYSVFDIRHVQKNNWSIVRKIFAHLLGNKI